MRVRTLALYLIGDRQAILDLAADRRALWVGLLLVLSAGFAREYDGQDLLREPWHLLIPVGASLATSFLLFLVACGPVFFRKVGRPPFLAAYRSFLTLFWMTAPLAWLYAIPYERLLSPGYATEANLWTLALVAAWRVALMVRVVSVLTNRDVFPSACLVMAFADAVALAAISMIPQPVVGIMGGIRLTESEAAIHNATFLVYFLGLLSAPYWALGGLCAFFSDKQVWQVSVSFTEPVAASRGMWIVAALSLAVWLPILPWTQAEQRLRTSVEERMKAGRVAEALDLMSAHAQSDFPPQWEPPPRVGYGEKTPPVIGVLEVILSRDSAPWMRAIYAGKLRRYLVNEVRFRRFRWDELPTVVRILKQLPEGPDIAAEYRNELRSWLDSPSSPADREDVNALLELAEKGVAPKY